MVITVAAFYIENHAPDHLFRLRNVAGQNQCEFQQIFIIQTAEPVRRMKQSARCMHMHLALRSPVKPLNAEVSATVFRGEKMSWRHINPGFLCRQ